MRLRGVIALAALNPSAQFSTAVTRRATSRVLPRATHALATSSPNAGAESYTLQKVSGGTRVGLPPPLTIQTMPKDIEDTVVRPDGAAARQDLLKWWDAGHRAMPWRRETPADDKKAWAYGVWVSEVMLQQTQVSRVDPYWRKWMARWPSVESLAQADESDVKALWSGLGYYRGCAFLLEGAKQLASANEWPTSKDQWLKVKGVGPYTAAAISSIVYGERTPVVDGNVVRVFSRLAMCGEKPTAKVWWSLAGSLTEGCDRPGAINQALMELGATVCSKQKPSCSGCPLRGHCAAFKTQTVDKYPVVVKKAPPVKVAVCLVVLRHGNRVALVAPKKERTQSPFRLEGLWELPGTRIEGEPDDKAIARGLDDALKSVGPVRKGLRAKKPLSHSITSTRYAVHVQRVDVDDPALYSNVEWVAVDDLGTKGCSSVVKKAVDASLKIDAKRKLPKGQQTLSFSKKKAPRVSPPPPEPVTVTPPSPPTLATPSAFGAYAFAE